MICRVHRSNLDDASGIHSFEMLCLECSFYVLSDPLCFVLFVCFRWKDVPLLFST